MNITSIIVDEIENEYGETSVDLEEIDIDDGNLCVIFESAGEKYFEGTDGKGVSTSPIDKILQIDLESF